MHTMDEEKAFMEGLIAKLADEKDEYASKVCKLEIALLSFQTFLFSFPPTASYTSHTYSNSSHRLMLLSWRWMKHRLDASSWRSSSKKLNYAYKYVIISINMCDMFVVLFNQHICIFSQVMNWKDSWNLRLALLSRSW